MIWKKIALAINFLFISIVITNNVFAYCASAPQVAAEHMQTRGLVTTQHSTTKALVSFEAALIREKIVWTSSILQKEIRSQTAAIGQMIKVQNQFLEDLMKSIAVSQEQAIIERTYGDQSIPKIICNNKDLAATRNQVEKSLTLKALAEARKHNEQYSQRQDANNAIDNMLANAPKGDGLVKILSADTIQPVDQKKALESLIYLTDRTPPRPLTDNEKKGIAAREYERVREIRNKKIAIPQKVFADHVTSRLPTLPLGPWAADQWQAMGGTGPVPGVVDDKISSVALTNFFVDSRIANPNWLAVDVISMNEVGLLRESLYMQAVDLYMKRKQTSLLEQIALMLALQLSNDVVNTEGIHLNHLETKLGN